MALTQRREPTFSLNEPEQSVSPDTTVPRVKGEGVERAQTSAAAGAQRPTRNTHADAARPRRIDVLEADVQALELSRQRAFVAGVGLVVLSALIASIAAGGWLGAQTNASLLPHTAPHVWFPFLVGAGLLWHYHKTASDRRRLRGELADELFRARALDAAVRTGDIALIRPMLLKLSGAREESSAEKTNGETPHAAPAQPASTDGPAIVDVTDCSCRGKSTAPTQPPVQFEGAQGNDGPVVDEER